MFQTRDVCRLDMGTIILRCNKENSGFMSFAGRLIAPP
jgi:hypothetical protein